jgi:hypothetical protein
VDSLGDAYVIGYTTSTNFPTVNPLQPANAGTPDALVTDHKRHEKRHVDHHGQRQRQPPDGVAQGQWAGLLDDFLGFIDGYGFTRTDRHL